MIKRGGRVVLAWCQTCGERGQETWGVQWEGEDPPTCGFCGCFLEKEARERTHRETRRTAIARVFQRAARAGRGVFGFSSETGETARVLKMAVPESFDHLCVEGEKGWERVPCEWVPPERAKRYADDGDDERRDQYTRDPDAEGTG